MKLSIILPCLNVKERILNIYNELNEKLKNIKYELIFVDNNSTDGTLDALKELYEKDMLHIKIISMQKEYSIDEIYYIGIKHANGEYICLDDISIEQSKLIEMFNYLENNQEDVVILGINDNNKLINNLYDFRDKLFNMKLERYTTKIRMFRNKVREYYLKYSECYSNLKGIFTLMNYKTKYLSLDKIINIRSKDVIKEIKKYRNEFSNKPFSFITLLAGCFLVISFIYLIVLLLIGNYSLNNFIIFLILLLTGILLIIEGIVSNEINNRVKEIKKNKIYIIKEKIGFEENNIL